ncbi:C3a anaphylatoxin chemotactic receptor-like [Hypanus sabinus]|uniref:C3a anaphylatoxin chemotactic receptor-like n=1 Tax=Hypanus sabinus TaxID=79690 RepID=UPI0028C48014|nr:C3a anaphylatoxin chemotactic receptor-like [Hypanus sabinus]
MSLSEGVHNSMLTGNHNHSNATASRFKMEWRAPSVISMAIFTLTVLLGLTGNGAVIWVTGFKMKRNVHTVCFLNLAAADLLFCLCLPLQMLYVSVLGSGDGENTLSSLLTSIMYLYALASRYLLCLISIYRCLAVNRPIWFQQHLKLAWVRVNCFVVWVIATVMSLLAFFLLAGDDALRILAAFSFVPPFVIMITCYTIVGWRLHGDRFAKSRKPIRLLMTAVAAFVICWLPVSICNIAQIGFDLPDWIMLFQALASFNSALNPLVYVFAGSDFRQVFKRSLFASLQLAFAEQEIQGETQNRNPNSDMIV